MIPFVSVALKVQEELHITGKQGVAMTMRFAKIYPPEKMGEILRVAKEFAWWESNPTAAFMKAVSLVNTKDPSKSDIIYESKPRKNKQKKLF